jgi:hypothetical protein
VQAGIQRRWVSELIGAMSLCALNGALTSTIFAMARLILFDPRASCL